MKGFALWPHNSYPTQAVGGFAAWFGDVQDIFPNFRNIQHGKAFGEQMLFWRWSIFRRPNLMKLPWGMVQKRTGEALRLKNEKFIKIPISFSFSHSSWFFASFERGSRETTFIHIAPYHAYHLLLSKIPSCRPTHWAFKVAAFKAMKHMIRLVKTCQLLSWSACLSWHLQKWVVEIMMDLMIVLQFFGFGFLALQKFERKNIWLQERDTCCFQGFQDSNIFPWACPKPSQRPCAISSVPTASLLAM